jgi:hypothetical protein
VTEVRRKKDFVLLCFSRILNDHAKPILDGKLTSKAKKTMPCA